MCSRAKNSVQRIEYRNCRVAASSGPPGLKLKGQKHHEAEHPPRLNRSKDNLHFNSHFDSKMGQNNLAGTVTRREPVRRLASSQCRPLQLHCFFFMWSGVWALAQPRQALGNLRKIGEWKIAGPRQPTCCERPTFKHRCFLRPRIWVILKLGILPGG